MSSRPAEAPVHDIREARRLFPATSAVRYFDTAALGLASSSLAAAYHAYVDEWAEHGPDYLRGEQAGDRARAAVAAIIGAAPSDVALIASVSAAAGLVAAQLGPAAPGHNVVIGEREYSSNHFPWRLLAGKGYDVRQVAFRNGGLEPDDIARRVDGGTVLVAFSGVQSATGHRSDIRAIGAMAHEVGALVFVDGSQLVGALPVAEHLDSIDVLATSDHKFLLNAGRGLGYCYLAPSVQDRFTPINAGWKAARAPLDSYYGPEMELSPTASRFDSSISWLAAIGDEVALSVFDTFGLQTVLERNRELAELLTASLFEAGWAPVALPSDNRSTIVAVPMVDREPEAVVAQLRARGIVCSARDGNLRMSVHLYNHEDDIEELTSALSEL